MTDAEFAGFGTLPSVLVLDDDPTALEEIQEILELDDITSVGATSAFAAEAVLNSCPSITAVVTDVHLDASDERCVNGVEFISEMRKRLAGRPIAFIVLSGDPGAIVSSIKTGAADFLTKPLVPEDLLRALRKSDSALQETPASDVLLRKVEETTKSLQQATINLAQRDKALSENQAAYDRQRVQGGKLRQGLADGHLQPWFQPQLCMNSGRITGFEALVRWMDPKSGMQNPADFLPLAHEIGLIEELDRSVQKQAFVSLKNFHSNGIFDCVLGINVTATQLLCRDFVSAFETSIRKAGLKPNNVSVEILESTMLDDKRAEPIKRNIEAIAGIGVGIELDDFGTGHAGLSSLRDLSVSRIKIDRSFVRNVHNDEKLQNFTRALIGLAKTLNVKVLAEGVETAEELRWLSDEGCDAVQGFYLAKPMPLDAALDWGKSWKSGGPLTDLMARHTTH